MATGDPRVREPDRPRTWIELLGDVSARAARSPAGCRRQVTLVLAVWVPAVIAFCFLAVVVDVTPTAAAIGSAAAGSAVTAAAGGRGRRRRRGRDADDPAPPVP